MPGLIPGECDLVGLRGRLDIGNFRGSPGDYNVRPTWRRPALESPVIHMVRLMWSLPICPALPLNTLLLFPPAPSTVIGRRELLNKCVVSE